MHLAGIDLDAWHRTKHTGTRNVRRAVPLGYVCRMSADASLISVTAKLAAYYRQFSDIPFATEVAKRIGADEAFDRILREHGLERDKLTFYAPMFEARYKSITQLTLESAASQVLELASGYSLRGLDLTRRQVGVR